MNFINAVQKAAARLSPYIHPTPLYYHERLSAEYHCRVYLKREDQQPVRSYKIRGALNKILSLSEPDRARGICCASAGNHAQGVAWACNKLRIQGKIFMPVNTPAQKIARVKAHGGIFITIQLVGETYDEAADAAKGYSEEQGAVLIPPFDDEKVIRGQATVAAEILHTLPEVDYLFMPVGGGGLAAGIGQYFRELKKKTTLIGVEPAGAASMKAAFDLGRPVQLVRIDPFVDGAAVREVGRLTYDICKQTLDRLHTVSEGKVCSTLLQFYNEDGIVTEPAGCLSMAALEDFADEIMDKTVVCILSGSNNDSNRMEEIKKLADAWEGLQHYLVVRFQHYPDGLQQFFISVLGPGDYVNRVEYIRRDHGRSTYALLGLRSESQSGYLALTERLRKQQTEFHEVGKEEFLFKYWV